MFSFALVSVRATNGREERAQKLGQAKLASALEQEHKGSSTVQNIFILKYALNWADCVHLTAVADSKENLADMAVSIRVRILVCLSANPLRNKKYSV